MPTLALFQPRYCSGLIDFLALDRTVLYFRYSDISVGK